MSSLYHRLDFTKTKALKTPKSNIWERLDFTRPPRSRQPRCSACRMKIQTGWRICPQCGALLASDKVIPRHCIWVDPSGMIFEKEHEDVLLEVLGDSFSKVFSAFRSIQVFLTSEPPDLQEWGENYTHVYVMLDEQPVDYLGIASFKHGTVTDRALVRIDQILDASSRASLSLNQLSNLIANTIAHEIGHTLGLDHSDLPTDVMHDGLDHQVHSVMPPSFHAEQILRMNHAIYRYRTALT